MRRQGANLQKLYDYLKCPINIAESIVNLFA